MTGSVNCPVTGNDACGFGYCGDGRCHLRDYVVKSASQPVPSTPSLPAQIEAVRAAIARREQQTEDWPFPESEIPKLMAALVTLQQHERLEAALEESVKLQGHYAMLLNSYDGGSRIIFENATMWLARLAALGTAAQVEPEITPEMLRAGISVAEAHFLRAHGAWRDLVVAVYRAMYISRPSPSGETEVALSRKDIAENTGGPR